VIELTADGPVRLAIKLPDAPRTLNVADPYPTLLDTWNPTTRQWSWEVPSTDEVPDVERAIEIAQQFQSGSELVTVTGAGALASDPNGGSAPPA
jgi:hypothetical protein